jgi:hypothetical protein
MTLWEYKIVELLSSEDTHVAEVALNELSADGWQVQEVFGVAGKGDTTCFLLRRAAPGDGPGE